MIKQVNINTVIIPFISEDIVKKSISELIMVNRTVG